MDKVKITMKDKTASLGVQVYFLVARYADGCLLGWYSRNPASHVRDQERGWVVIDPKQHQIIDECETFSWGASPGNNWRDWMVGNRVKHGKAKYFVDECGQRVWSMTRDT